MNSGTSLHGLPSPLPRFDRNLLRLIERVVPLAEREEWSRSWHAELWDRHHRNRGRKENAPADSSTDLSIGLIRDALWLRQESWRRLYEGTATACVATLVILILIAALVALAYTGDRHALSIYLSSLIWRFLVGAPLVLVVSFANAPRRYTNAVREQDEAGDAVRTLHWMRRKFFFVLKSALILFLAFLVSADICQPMHTFWPATSDILQVLFFEICAIAGLRWAFHDQEQRCKQCLRLLAAPARVGRPSHNLLEWNGTQLICKQGHGVLSVPEMETSWCATSTWIRRDDCWDQTASV